MRLLVTGGAGFIGSAFVRLTLGTTSDDVTVLDKLTYAGNRSNLASVERDPRFRFVEGDISDQDLVNDLAGSVDCIVNFAAETHVDRSLESPGAFITTDVYGVYVLMEAARRHRHERFLHVSTDEVYGDVSEGRCVETDALRPRSPYSASKAGGEMLIASYVTSFGFPAIVTRGSNTYGPYQFPEKIIPLFITNALEGRTLPLYGSGTAVRDYLYVDDHCTGIATALRSGTPGEIYNVGIGTEISGVEVADAILGALGLPDSRKEYVRDRPGHDMRYAISAAKLNRLGWSAKYDFARGIRETVDWYRDQEDWWKPLKSEDFWQFYSRNYKPAVAGDHA